MTDFEEAMKQCLATAAPTGKEDEAMATHIKGINAVDLIGFPTEEEVKNKDPGFACFTACQTLERARNCACATLFKRVEKWLNETKQCKCRIVPLQSDSPCAAGMMGMDMGVPGVPAGVSMVPGSCAPGTQTCCPLCP